MKIRLLLLLKSTFDTGGKLADAAFSPDGSLGATASS